MALNKTSLKKLAAYKEVIYEFEEYWPMTLRQIYYQLVSRLLVKNNVSGYRSVGRVLRIAREDGLLTYDCMEDRSRSILRSDGWWDSHRFIEFEFGDFLKGYRRDLMQTQDTRLEIWIEKDALSAIFHEIAHPFCIPVVVAKGYVSTSYVGDFRDRIDASIRPTKALYFGDYDPSGWNMPETMEQSLIGKMHVDADKLQIVRCGLLPEQIERYSLLKDPHGVNTDDPRAPRFLREHGDDVSPVEFDSLHPDEMKELVKESILANIDVREFEEQKLIEVNERESIAEKREKVMEFIEELE